jgi:hypothetical protein
MTNRLSTEILINLAGNLTAKARQYGANMSEFASRNQRAMSIVRATTEAAGRGLDMLENRYVGLIAGFAGGAMLKSYMTLDRRISRMAVSSEVSRKQARDMFREIEKYATDNAIPVSELADAWDQVVEKTGDYKRAMSQLPVMATAIAGAGVSGHDVGDLSVFFGQLGIKSREEIQRTFDMLNKQGKVGEFSFADMATVGAPVFAALSGYGGKGFEGAKEGGALLQYGMNATADKNQAATSVLSFMADVMNKQNLIKKYAGIDVVDKNGQFASPALIYEKLITKAMKNKNGARLFMQEDPKKPIGALGFSEPTIKLMLAGVSDYRNNNGKLSQLGHYMHVDGDGSLAADAKTVMDDFTSSVQKLNNAFDIFKEKNLAGPVQTLADALNKVNSDTAQNWLNTGKNIGIALAGVIAARKVFKIGKGMWDFLNPGKGKGIPKGVADVFGSGVMPVYVVNMGSGGMGGGIADALGESGGRGGRLGRFGRMARGAGKFAGVAGAGFALYDHLENNYQLDGKVDDLTKQVASNTAASPQERAFAEESQRNRQALKNKWEQWFGSSEDPSAQIIDPRPWAGMAPVTPNVNFASVPSSSNPKGPDIPQLQGNEHSLWAAITDFFMGANTTIESGMPSVKQQDNSPQLPPVPQKLQGEIRVVVEGDARVKSVKMDQPGVTLSASAGVSNVEQN